MHGMSALKVRLRTVALLPEVLSSFFSPSLSKVCGRVLGFECEYRWTRNPPLAAASLCVAFAFALAFCFCFFLSSFCFLLLLSENGYSLLSFFSLSLATVFFGSFLSAVNFIKEKKKNFSFFKS